MEILNSILFQFFWTLVGALIGFLIPIISIWWKHKRRPELLGAWKSAYQGIEQPEGTWVTEEVLISLSLGKLHLKNMNSSHGYNYTGYGSIIERVHITGNWESVRPGANAYGAFMLTISSQGDFLYGYWVGADKVGAQRYGRWVLARNWGSIEEAKALLEKMRHPIAPT